MGLAGISAESRTELARLTAGRRLVTVDDASDLLRLPRPEAARRLARFAEQGWLRRVRRGLYIPVPIDAPNPESWSEDPLVLANAVWAPCYFTGWTAANHWALTDQVFATTVVKTQGRVRHATQHLGDDEFLLSHVDAESMDWGLATVWRNEVRLTFADAARTVIDLLDEPRLGGGIRHVAEILDSYLVEHDAGRLVDYGDRLGNGTVFKRLGLLTQSLSPSNDELITACRDRVTKGVTSLDPDGPAGGTTDRSWGLRVNVGVTS